MNEVGPLWFRPQSPSPSGFSLSQSLSLSFSRSSRVRFVGWEWKESKGCSLAPCGQFHFAASALSGKLLYYPRSAPTAAGR